MVSRRVTLYINLNVGKDELLFLVIILDIDFIRHSKWLYFGKFNLFVLEARSITLLSALFL